MDEARRIRAHAARQGPSASRHPVAGALLWIGLWIGLWLIVVVAPTPASAQGAPTDLVPPQLVGTLVAPYPAALVDAETPDPLPTGTVTVKYVIGVDGIPLEVEVAEAVHPALDAAAMEAVQAARFKPATYHGRPVEIATSTAFVFDPPAPEPASDKADTDEGTADFEDAAVEDAAVVPDSDPAPDLAIAGGTGPIRGVVLEAGQRTPVPNARITLASGAGLEPGSVRPREFERWSESAAGKDALAGWSFTSTANAQGEFQFGSAVPGPVVVIVLTPGFERRIDVFEAKRDEALDLKLFQTRDNRNPNRTVVRTERPAAEVVRRTLSRAELESIPGTQNDPLKGVQNLPGFSRSAFGLGQLSIRGASPGDSAVYLGGHELPQLFHFGGVSSVYNGGLIESIDYLPSNFGTQYGDATGGIVDVTPAAPRRDGYHGYASADVLGAAGLIQGPVGEGGFAAAVRRSYVDAITPSGVGVTLLPRYWDYQSALAYPLGSRTTLTLRAFGSDDRYVALDDDAGSFDLQQWFHRADAEVRARLGKWTLLTTPSFLYFFSEDLANESEEYRFSLRSEARYVANPRFNLTFGTESRFGWVDLSVSRTPSEIPGPPTPGGQVPSESRFKLIKPALYAAATRTTGGERPLAVAAGVRGTYDAEGTGEFTIDPRVSARWSAGERLAFFGGVGMHSQSPEPIELDRVFGNPELAPERSLQTSLGGEAEFPADVSLQLTGFYKHVWDVAVASEDIVLRGGVPVLERLSSSGTVRSYGAEALLRRDFSRQLYGWLAYTLSRSELRTGPAETYEATQFDQTHILSLVGGYKLPRNWSVGARFRLVSGAPFTPVANGVYDAGTGRWQPFVAAENSGRLPVFHQLDLRVDKTWTYRFTRLMLYLDVQNVYNRKNAEFQVYSYDFRESDRITSFPLIPSVGLRLDW